MSPVFSVDPDWCTSSSSMTPPNDSCIAGSMSYDADFVSGPKITIAKTMDLCSHDPDDPGHVPGRTIEPDTVPVVFQTCDYNGDCTDYPVDTPVNLKNPCVDKTYVNIIAPNQFDREDYIVATAAETFPAHGAFVVTTEPDSHNLCGDLNLMPYYQPVTDGDFVEVIGSHPVSYDAAGTQFTADSDDQTLIDTTKQVKVVA